MNQRETRNISGVGAMTPAPSKLITIRPGITLPPIEVTPLAGKLLHLLVRISGARRVLEIGTLGGYSTIWLARALPTGGRVVTIEAEPRNAEPWAALARAEAGLGKRHQALHAYRKALEIDSAHQEVRWELEKLEFELGLGDSR